VIGLVLAFNGWRSDGGRRNRLCNPVAQARQGTLRRSEILIRNEVIALKSAVLGQVAACTLSSTIHLAKLNSSRRQSGSADCQVIGKFFATAKAATIGQDHK
jgi:hypothetical protein